MPGPPHASGRNQSVASRPRFGYRQQPVHVSQVVAVAAWWRRGGGVSQAEPGTSAKGHLAVGFSVSINVSSLLS
jgi:hypothetical protein